MDYSAQGHKESDITQRLTQQQQQIHNIFCTKDTDSSPALAVTSVTDSFEQNSALFLTARIQNSLSS